MSDIDNSLKFYTHISSKKSWFNLNLREVWRYRDLILLFTKKNFVVTYKQTILGPLWIFLNPFLTSLIYTFVFGGIAGIGTDGIPQILFYLCGSALWTFFSTSVTKNAQTFTANANVFGKVYFPRLTTPISNVLASIIQFAVQMILVVVFLIYYVYRGDVKPHWELMIFIPFILLHLGLLGLGCGIIISSLTTKYRDLAILVTFGVQLWMYATPVVYPISQLGDGIMRTIIMINPVTAPFETFRHIILGQGYISLQNSLLSFGITLGIALIGIMIFNRVEKTFMDTV